MQASQTPCTSKGILIYRPALWWRTERAEKNSIRKIPREKIKLGVVHMFRLDEESGKANNFFIAVKPQDPTWLITTIKATEDNHINNSVIVTAEARGWIVLRKDKRGNLPVIFQGVITARKLMDGATQRTRIIMRHFNQQRVEIENSMRKRGEDDHHRYRLTDSSIREGISNSKYRKNPFSDD